jgi:hypothetical protein
MVEVAQLPDQSTRRNESSMAELTIVFRLRFAVAVTIALTLLLALQARDAFAEEGVPAEYIVQMDTGVAPAQGQQLVTELGGQVTTGEVSVINGFGAVLQDDAAEELVNSAGVRAVTPNSATAPVPAPTTPDPNNAVAESGGLRCPTRPASAAAASST